MKFEFEMEVDIDITMGAEIDGFAAMLAGGFIRAMIGSVIREVLPDDVDVLIIPVVGVVMNLYNALRKKDGITVNEPIYTIPVFVEEQQPYASPSNPEFNKKLDGESFNLANVSTNRHTLRFHPSASTV